MNEEKNENINDKDIQVVLGTLLRAGVIISMSIVLIGGVIFLIHNKGVITDYKVFKPELSKFSSIGEIFKGLSSFHGDAIVQFGILMLIFTPIARIIFAIFSFLIEKDYLYVLIGFIILAIITISLNGGLAH
ncbi:DUF1634 domain-containing protein [Pedobacter sp. MC2016-05]|uniref:DUF1634 domain-containing protein n=1 Tax=unclassified Pedobacter TaxID=2628915 RepID=UPI00070305B4|nr:MULTISPECIES: DUF1634 domain-containing protein [unclassified Pedobacter]KQN38332.1 hypothetical protein ASE92_02545 [Pedobacter sp. Leaf41]MCX2474832.1 DUF1634 domain-containing protein [Pedobacter sp. MC2016-05]RZK61449.1 MAG: DUF1634 domain-containing protein [Pedobacter sp.]